jgi:hypothetical protein
MRKLILKTLSCLLSFQTGIGLQLISYSSVASAAGPAVASPNEQSQNAQSHPSRAEIQNLRHSVQAKYMRDWAEAIKSGFGGRDPALRELMSTDLNEIQSSIPDFTGAPVDRDPFFIRSQSWISTNDKSTEFTFFGDERHTEIAIPGSAKRLIIEIPLRGLIATDEYLIFTLHPKSDLFDRVAGQRNAEGDGLFVIETSLLKTHATRNTPVPVFFVPIMGSGWRENLTALQIVEGDILAIANKEEVIPFLMKDIREIIQIAKINFDFSIMMSLTKRGSDGKVASDKLFPAPGSTALFGLVITGMDLTRPGYNFFRDFRALAHAGYDLSHTSVAANSLNLQLQRFFKFPILSLINSLGTTKAAQAQSSEDPVTAAIWRSAFFGSIVATTIVISFALKYKSKAVRQRLDEIHKYRQALDPETVNREKWKGFREFMRIEGSILASIAQFPLISPSIAVQYFVDRNMPSLGSGDHTLMRKILNQTIYPNLRHFGKIAVNEKVTILGTGNAATLGIGVGALHYFYLLPAFIQAVSPALPQGLSYALNETFSTQNRQTQATLFTNLLVGASIGILRGPADFTMDAKSQVIEELYARVDNSLRREGLNPDDPKLQSRRENMREALVNLTLVQKGLPTSKEVLFDTMSLYTSVSGARGYSTPTNDMLLANINPNAKDIPYAKDGDGKALFTETGKAIVQEGNFILASRRGLLPGVLSRAHAQAKAWNESNPSSDTAAALKLVEQMIQDSERLRKILPRVAQELLMFLENPSLLVPANAKTNPDLARLQKEIREISTTALAFRQLIVMSNYEGAIEYSSRYLPVTWAKDYGTDATNMAVLYLRQALASYLDGATLENVVSRRVDFYAYSEKARKAAIEAMRADRPELEGRSDALILADANLRAEALQRANILTKAYGDQERAEQDAQKFKPNQGWIENWRHRRALRRAEARLAQYALENPSPEKLTKENLELKLRDFYVSESAKQIGLRIQDFAVESEKDVRTNGRAPWQTDSDKFKAMMREVQANSELLANRQFESLGMKTYLAKLNERDATNLKLQLHAAIFLAAYRDATTMSGALSGLDTAQPGFTQGLRQALARQTDKDLSTLERMQSETENSFDRKLLRLRQRVVSITASTANRALRVVDSMFHDLSVDRGALGVIQRRVPFAEELVSANIRNVKFWPVAFTVSWTWSHFALGTGIDYSFWVTSILTQGIFVMAPVQWLFRNFRMQEFKPYDSDRPGWSGVRHLAGKYSLSELLGYTVTFVAIMPAVLLTSEVGRNLTTYIGNPIVESFQRFSFVEVSTAFMSGVLAYIAGGKVYERWRMSRTMGRLAVLQDSVEQSGEQKLSKDLRSQGVDLPLLRTCEGSFLPVAN